MQPLTPAQEAVIAQLFYDRPLAHEVIFGKGHKNLTPPFHNDLIQDFHSTTTLVGAMAFRGSAKTTRMEEGTALRAGFREFKNCVIVSANLALAMERVHAIRRILEKNEMFKEVFGDLRGPRWGDELIETSSGIVIQALGKGQAVRGKKEEELRPDLLIVDDVEDRSSVRTPEMREGLQAWFFGELLPAVDVGALVRMYSNDLHPECLARVCMRPKSGWTIKVYPWLSADEAPIWPQRYDLGHIMDLRARMYALGRGADYEAQYMCNSQSPESKPFKPEMIRVTPRIKAYEFALMAFDPARSAKANAADTGYACWSWVGPKMIVWDAWGKKLLPNEIVENIYTEARKYEPVKVGVDQIGLNEFLMQPLRTEGVRQGMALPLVPVPAGKSKDERIRALQPYFNAREVEFATDLPELRQQLLGYPSGVRDVLDALAYALVMRPGAPMYEDFTTQNIGEGLDYAPRQTVYLVLNATRSLLTGQLVQAFDGGLRVYADAVREGDCRDHLLDMVRWAQVEAGDVRVVGGPSHFDQYNHVGLVQAAAKIPIRIQTGAALADGQAEIRGLLRRQTRGFPSLMVSTRAHWTANAMGGGYSRALLRGGVLADYAEEGVYRVLMEGLESFAGLLKMGQSPEESERARLTRTTATGQRYHTYASSRTFGGRP